MKTAAVKNLEKKQEKKMKTQKLIRTIIALNLIIGQVASFDAAYANTMLGPANNPNEAPGVDPNEVVVQADDANVPSGSMAESKPLSAVSNARVANLIEVREGDSIKDAVVQAQEGDTIMIYAGVYQRLPGETFQLSLKKNVKVKGVVDENKNRPAINDFTWYMEDGAVFENLILNPASTADLAGVTINLGYQTKDIVIKNVKTTAVGGFSNNLLIVRSEFSGNGQHNSTQEIEIFGDNNKIVNTKATGYGNVLRMIGNNNAITKSILHSLGPLKYTYCYRGQCQPAVQDEPVVVVQGVDNVISGNTIVGYGSGYHPDSENAAGIKISGGTGNRIINTIIANTGPSVLALAKVYASYSLFQTAGLPKNVIGQKLKLGVDPRFRNLAEGNFRLKKNSPAIDAGSPDSPRDPDGTRADIGAFALSQVSARSFETAQAQDLTSFVKGNPNRINVEKAEATASNPDYFVTVKNLEPGHIPPTSKSFFKILDRAGNVAVSIVKDLSLHYLTSVKSREALGNPDVSPDGKSLMAAWDVYCTRAVSDCARNSVVQIMDIETKKIVNSVNLTPLLPGEKVLSARFAPNDPSRIRISLESGNIAFYDIQTGRINVREVSVPVPSKAVVTSSPNGGGTAAIKGNRVSIKYGQALFNYSGSAVLSYDSPKDFSKLPHIAVGLQGKINAILAGKTQPVIMTLTDTKGKKVSVNLTGIKQDSEAVKFIPKEKLQGINLSNVASIAFSIAGYNIQGSYLNVRFA